MNFKSLVFVVCQALAVLAVERRATTSTRPVLTATKVFHDVVSQSPFMVDRTTVITWTQSPSITESQPTIAPTASIGADAVTSAGISAAVAVSADTSEVSSLDDSA